MPPILFPTGTTPSTSSSTSPTPTPTQSSQPTSSLPTSTSAPATRLLPTPIIILLTVLSTLIALAILLTLYSLYQRHLYRVFVARYLLWKTEPLMLGSESGGRRPFTRGDNARIGRFCGLGRERDAAGEMGMEMGGLRGRADRNREGGRGRGRGGAEGAGMHAAGKPNWNEAEGEVQMKFLRLDEGKFRVMDVKRPGKSYGGWRGGRGQ